MKQRVRTLNESNALKTGGVQLSLLVDMDRPLSVLTEILNLSCAIHPNADLNPVHILFTDVVALFSGSYPGYKACTTGYHNLKHTTDTVLAMARLMHGARVEGENFSAGEMTLGLMAAMLHDVGYIQHEKDQNGTGALLAPIHVQRSVEFMTRYFEKKAYPQADIRWVEKLIRCTDLNCSVDTVRFQEKNGRRLGQMLAAADLLAQTADRNYLEKLPRLYYEFREAGLVHDGTELDFIKESLAFNQRMNQRLRDELDDVHRYMTAHFTVRWDIRQNLYQDSIRKSMHYLATVLLPNSDRYPDRLRRKRGT